MTNGKQMGRYCLDRKIKSGGMGNIYLAHDPVLKRDVAVKVLKEELVDGNDPEVVALFRIEAELAAGLKHPNLVTIYDKGEQDGQFFIVMDYINGETLGQKLKREGALEERELASILKQICAGLEAAHKEDIVHADLKPGNVMIDAHGHVTIIDFGIARAIHHTRKHTGKISEFMGTPPYASPEQMRGEEPDQRSDLYSLAFMVHELSTGRRPLLTPDTARVLWPTKPVVGKDQDQEEPTALDHFFFKALHPQKENRFGSTSELLAAFKVLPKPKELAGYCFENRAIHWGMPREPIVEPKTPEAVATTDETKTTEVHPRMISTTTHLPKWFPVAALVLAGVLSGIWWVPRIKQIMGWSAVMGPVDITVHLKVMGSPPEKATIRILESKEHDEVILDHKEGGSYTFHQVEGLRRKVTFGIKLGFCSKEFIRTVIYDGKAIDLNLEVDEYCRDWGDEKPWSSFVGPIPIAILGFRNETGDPEKDWIGKSLERILRFQGTTAQKFEAVDTSTIPVLQDWQLPKRGETAFDKYDLVRIKDHSGAELVLYGTYNENDGKSLLDICLQETYTSKNHGWKTVSVSSELESGGIEELVIQVHRQLVENLELSRLEEARSSELEANFTGEEVKDLFLKGEERLRYYDAVGAQDLFQKAIKIDNGFGPAYLGLSRAWTELGRDEKSADAAALGLQLTKEKLTPGSNLDGDWALAQGIYLEAQNDWESAIDFYSVLWRNSLHLAKPDFENALSLSRAQIYGGQLGEAFVSFNTLESEQYLTSLSLIQRVRLNLLKAHAYILTGDFSLTDTFAKDAIEAIRNGGKEEEPGFENLLARANLLNCAAKAQGKQETDLNWDEPCEQAIFFYTRSGNKNGLAKAHSVLGAGKGNRKDRNGARKEIKTAFVIFEELGNVRAQIEQLINLSAVQGYGNQLEEALNTCQDLYILAEKQASSELFAKACSTSAASLMELGILEGEVESDECRGITNQRNDCLGALELYKTALSIYREIDTPLYEAYTRTGLGYLFHKMVLINYKNKESKKAESNLIKARDSYERGLETIRNLERDTRFFADELLRYARLLYDMGEVSSALDSLDEAKVVYTVLGAEDPEMDAEKIEKEMLVEIEELLFGTEATFSEDGYPNWVGDAKKAANGKNNAGGN